MIRHSTDSDLARVRGFLERHVDTSVFLLSTLGALGPHLGEHPSSGNFQLLEENGEIVAVFCLTRRGNLLVQAGGRADLARRIFRACEAEPIRIRGIVGEWGIAEPLWQLLSADPQFEPRHNLKDVLYRMMLAPRPAPPGSAERAAVNVRLLGEPDFVQWERLNSAYFTELHLPVRATLEQRRSDFVGRIRSGLWWGAFDHRHDLTSIASVNATYGSVAQVGGVYTRPGDRRKGLAKVVMTRLIEDSGQRLGFTRLILFTGETNAAARRLYESLGFEAGGAFGLLLGERHTNTRASRRHR